MLAASIAVGSVSYTLVQRGLDELSPMALATGRVTVSALMFSFIVLARPGLRTPIPRHERWRVFAIGFGGSAVFHLLFNWGQSKVPVAIAAVIMATYPVMTTVGEVLFLGYRLRRVQAVGVVLSTAGCIAIGVTGGVGDGDGSLWGALAVAAAALTWAAVTLVTRDIGERYDSWWLNTPGTVVGAMFMLAITAPELGEYGSLSWQGWLVVVWLGSASSAFIYYALARTMRVLSATTTTAISTVVTPLSVLVAWGVRGEVPTLAQLLGGAVVIGGVMLVLSVRSAA
jgi:drug/metabolite transporter (DMT)-like permease